MDLFQLYCVKTIPKHRYAVAEDAKFSVNASSAHM